MMNLNKCILDCNKDVECLIIRIDGGIRAKIRLAHLGILPGMMIIKTMQAPFKGPITIMVKSASIVIGRGLAAKIMVRCLNHDEL